MTKVLFKTYWFLLLQLAFFSGCTNTVVSAVKTIYKKDNYHSIAIVPFENLSQNKNAGQDLALYTYTHLSDILYKQNQPQLDLLKLEIKDEHLVYQLYSDYLENNHQTFKPENWPAFAESLNVQFLLTGYVSEYNYDQKTNQWPVASLHLRLYDVSTNTLIWSGSHTDRNGYTLGQVANHVCQDLITKMLSQLKHQRLAASK